MKSLLKTFCQSILLISFCSCGGDSIVTPPSELPSVKVGSGNALDSGSVTNLSSIPSSLNISFESALDVSTVSNENISLACEEEENISVALAEDTDGIPDNEISITPEISLPELDTCTLTISTGLKSFNLVSNEMIRSKYLLNEELNYVFTTPCADTLPFRNEFRNEVDFFSDCWTSKYHDGNVNLDFDTDLGLLDFIGLSSFDSDSSVIVPELSREINFSEDMSLELKISSFENFIEEGSNIIDSDSFGISLGVARRESSHTCLIQGNGGLGVKLLSFWTDENGSLSGNTVTLSGTGSSSEENFSGESFYLRLQKNNDAYTCSYRISESGSYTDINAIPITGSTTADLGSIIFSNTHVQGNESSIRIDSLTLLSSIDE